MGLNEMEEREVEFIQPCLIGRWDCFFAKCQHMRGKELVGGIFIYPNNLGIIII